MAFKLSRNKSSHKPRYGTLKNVIAIGQMTNGVNKLRNGVKMIVNQVVDTVSQLYITQENRNK